MHIEMYLCIKTFHIYAITYYKVILEFIAWLIFTVPNFKQMKVYNVLKLLLDKSDAAQNFRSNKKVTK